MKVPINCKMALNVKRIIDHFDKKYAIKLKFFTTMYNAILEILSHLEEENWKLQVEENWKHFYLNCKASLEKLK